MKKFSALSLLVLFFVFISCKKEKDAPVQPTQPTNPSTSSSGLKIKFEAKVDTLPFVFGQNYTNANGDTFKLTTFKYYISNIKLTKTDNSVYTQPESYYLVDHSNAASTVLTLTNVPEGSYKSISFMLGVDSARNNSGAQTGALDPTKGMFWTWNSGYIFIKVEGTSPQSGSFAKGVTYHIGGYGGPDKTQRNFNLSFGSSTAGVTNTSGATINLISNVNEVFKSPTIINFFTDYDIATPGPAAKMIADNYADMITFKNIQ